LSPAVEDELDPRYAGWRVTLACAAAGMVGFGAIVVYGFGVLLKPVAAEFGWSRETLATAFACASFTLGLTSPVLGVLLDRFGPKRVIIPCAAAFGLAFASLALLQHSRLQLFATFILLGAVGNATAQMGYARVVSTWFERHRGLGLAVFMAGTTVGSIFVPPTALALIGRIGWRWTCVVLGSAPIAIATPLVLLVVREKSGTVKGNAAPAYGASVGEAMGSRAFWILAIMLFLTAMSTTGTITHLSPLLTDRGISARGAAWAVSAVGTTSILGRLTTGWALDRFYGPAVAMVLLFMTATGLLLLSGCRTLPTAIAAAGLFGFSMGGESDVVPYLIAKHFGLRRLGTLYGLTWTAYATAAALGSVLLGRAFDATGSYAELLTRLAVLVFIAGVLMAAMPRYRVHDSEVESDRIAAAEATS
jgi:MFS family permease